MPATALHYSFRFADIHSVIDICFHFCRDSRAIVIISCMIPSFIAKRLPHSLRQNSGSMLRAESIAKSTYKSRLQRNNFLW